MKDSGEYIINMLANLDLLAKTVIWLVKINRNYYQKQQSVHITWVHKAINSLESNVEIWYAQSTYFSANKRNKIFKKIKFSLKK